METLLRNEFQVHGSLYLCCRVHARGIAVCKQGHGRCCVGHFGTHFFLAFFPAQKRTEQWLSLSRPWLHPASGVFCVGVPATVMRMRRMVPFTQRLLTGTRAQEACTIILVTVTNIFDRCASGVGDQLMRPRPASRTHNTATSIRPLQCFCRLTTTLSRICFHSFPPFSGMAAPTDKCNGCKGQRPRYALRTGVPQVWHLCK